MKLRHLIIKNFRGIQEMDWKIPGEMICLIGPGDSTKTTILDAIENVLSPRWNIPFSDLDFYLSDTSHPIEITATVTQLPKRLIQEDKYGLFLSFWNIQDGDHDEEKESDEYSLIICLTVEASLEPQWYVVNTQTGEKRSISASDRELLGVAQIGAYIDRDLSWGRNSALTRLTGRERTEEIPAILADAARTARVALQKANLQQLSQSAKDLEVFAKSLGVYPKTGFHPGMDPLGININMGAITLLDGDVPLRSGGLGSRRLLVMAIHKDCSKDGSIILVDEIENGLEPFRLRNLIHTLRPINSASCQCFITTHSAISIVEHQSHELFVVRSENGKTMVSQLSNSLQNIVRGIPEAFLARSIIVCEGKTEWGLCRAMDDYWQTLGKPPLACMGIEPICSPRSGGSEAPIYAVELAKLGYQVVYFGDSDVPLTRSREEMESLGIKVILWADNVEVERRLCLDLPIEAISEFIRLAIQINGNEDSIWDQVKNATQLGNKDFSRDIFRLIEKKSEVEIRLAIGIAADHGSWFKRQDKGEELGKLVVQNINAISKTDSGLKLQELAEWCYA